ncbi:MAG: Mandelate racemase/muconate lactonizing protein [Massilia sp.]|nr:Mandelate racemase/muconate lactonizing protein [Massilia sp.]
MAEKLRKFNLGWLEEPVWPPENYEGLARLRREAGILIAAGENPSTLMDFHHMLQAGAVDFIQPSPAKMDGISELLAAAHNTTGMVRTFYYGPSLSASVHASAALGGADALVEWRFQSVRRRSNCIQRRPRNPHNRIWARSTCAHGHARGRGPRRRRRTGVATLAASALPADSAQAPS